MKDSGLNAYGLDQHFDRLWDLSKANCLFAVSRSGFEDNVENYFPPGRYFLPADDKAAAKV
jgi:hypothetical protein